MDITYHGAGCVRLSTRSMQLLFDPFLDTVRKPAPKLNADVVLFSDINQTVLADGLIIDGPGEYEVKGAMITGIPARRHTDETGEAVAIYRVNADGYNVALLGNIAPKLSSAQLEILGQVDVLVVPVGGHGLTLDALAASEIVSQVEPKFVVPTHYDDGKTTYAMPQDKIDTFLKEMGASPEPTPRLRLSSKDIPLETTIVYLQAA